MLKYLTKRCNLLILSFLYFLSCGQHDDAGSFISVPSNFPQPLEASKNKMSNDGIELGKMLFFDPILSADSSISCATCHNPTKAFTDGKKVSIGINNGVGERNAPSLYNLAWQKTFFRDGGTSELESQIIAPLTATFEMGHNLKVLVSQINNSPRYKAAFNDAFGSDTITTQRVFFAIAQFERTLVSGNSRYDKFIRKEKGVTLAKDELEGMKLFIDNCSVCHKGTFFTDGNFHNVGLDQKYADLTNHRDHKLGRARITGDPKDVGKYRTPSLRNVALTAPYMHDGRLNSLESVLDHYTENILPSDLVDTLLIVKDKSRIKLNEKEKKEIILFLNTLTDNSY